MHANSYQLFIKYCLPYFKPGAYVLELGPEFESSPGEYEALCDVISGLGANYVCANVTNSTPRYMSIPMLDEYTLDCSPDLFDVVISANVAEHVRKLWRWFPELVRVTKPGGIVISVSPVSWPYHASPIDCWRIYPDGYRALFEDAGLEVVHTSCESLVPIEPSWIHEHGNREVLDTIAVGRKPIRGT